MTPRVQIRPFKKPVEVSLDRFCIAYTRRAVVVSERGYPDRLYIPKDDVDMSRLERTSRATHCPFKGEASYFSIRAGERELVSAAWTYEEPIEQVQAIQGCICFDTAPGIHIDYPAGNTPRTDANPGLFPTADRA
ncbi:MAG: DUF427 domain-containing protein [Myxococcota bacterium]